MDFGSWDLPFLYSLFSFWPSPAVALIGAFLLPVAIRAGMPPLVVAISMNLFGHGFALSGDYVIQGTPKLTADAAKVPISEVIQASVPLVLVMGVVTTGFSVLWCRGMKQGEITMETGRTESISKPDDERKIPPHRSNKRCAFFWLLWLRFFFSRLSLRCCFFTFKVSKLLHSSQEYLL